VEELPCCAITDAVNENATTPTNKRVAFMGQHSNAGIARGTEKERRHGGGTEGARPVVVRGSQDRVP
jgi:hypothetical protein